MNGYAVEHRRHAAQGRRVDHRDGRRPRHPGRQAPEDEEERARGHLHDAARGRQVRGRQTTRRPAACTASAPPSSTRCRRSSSPPCKRDGATWEQRFKQGVPVGAAEEARPGARHRHDRLLPARPDDLPEDRVRRRRDPRAARGRELPPQGREGSPSRTRRSGEKAVFQHDEGHRRLPEEDRRRAQGDAGARGAVHADARERRERHRLEVALQWTESTDEHLRSYVNGIPTGSGGTHENGFRARPRQGDPQLHRDAQPLAQGRDAHRRGHPRGPASAC